MAFWRLLLILLLSFPLLAQGQAQKYYIYTYKNPNGQIVINNLPPAYMGKGHVLIDVKTGQIKQAITKSQMSQVLRSPELIELVDRIAGEHGVDTWLVRAIIQAESAFYERAYSKKGAMGLMQLIPATARRFGVIDPFDPVQNITGGVKYLRWLTDHFNNDYTKVIAAYNAGENAVKRHNGIPPFAETRAYVPRVKRLWESKSVVADPKASGAMDYLKKGQGGFEVNPQSAGNSVSPPEQSASPPKPLYSWTGADGGFYVSDRQPPKDARNVQVIKTQK